MVSTTISFGQFSDEKIVVKDKKVFLGGSISFDKSENRTSPIFINDIIILSNNAVNESENIPYSINPTIGYQVNDNWIARLDFY